MFSHKENSYPRYATIEKYVGETPLVTAERLRAQLHISTDVPLAYAGRLDPMASGKLLILIGDECKRQKEYHDFDKRYVVEVLLGAHSDTGDVLGLIDTCRTSSIPVPLVKKVFKNLLGPIAIPYPLFSSKTVKGKPLHTWTLENKLHEIDIPTNISTIYSLKLLELKTISREEVLETVRAKIETIPEVTDERKALGANFRRGDVRKTWSDFEQKSPETAHILTFSCIASSGTYMRSLAGVIGEKLGTCGLAYSIHRTHIGRYVPLWRNIGIWTRHF